MIEDLNKPNKVATQSGDAKGAAGELTNFCDMFDCGQLAPWHDAQRLLASKPG